jgi:hypothetical protein
MGSSRDGGIDGPADTRMDFVTAMVISSACPAGISVYTYLKDSRG